MLFVSILQYYVLVNKNLDEFEEAISKRWGSQLHLQFAIQFQLVGGTAQESCEAHLARCRFSASLSGGLSSRRARRDLHPRDLQREPVRTSLEDATNASLYL
jgi:hypothetical protein